MWLTEVCSVKDAIWFLAVGQMQFVINFDSLFWVSVGFLFLFCYPGFPIFSFICRNSIIENLYYLLPSCPRQSWYEFLGVPIALESLFLNHLVFKKCHVSLFRSLFWQQGIAWLKSSHNYFPFLLYIVPGISYFNDTTLVEVSNDLDS